jgi:autophagy-related protein 9
MTFPEFDVHLIVGLHVSCCRNVAFVAGACLAVLLILSIYDEDVITVEHVLTAITVLGAVVAGSR